MNNPVCVCVVGLRYTVEDAMVIEAGGPVDAVEIEEEEMVSRREKLSLYIGRELKQRRRRRQRRETIG